MKTINLASATLGAALLIAGSPVVASAATFQPSPIRLDSVQIAQDNGIHQDFAYPGLVSVAFTNETPETVTKVVFDLEAGGAVLDRIDDVGNYVQGQTVKHNFPDIQTDANQQLTVESVSFADGTTWNNTDAVAPRRQAAQVPVKAETAAELFPLFQFENE